MRADDNGDDCEENRTEFEVDLELSGVRESGPQTRTDVVGETDPEAAEERVRAEYRALGLDDKQISVEQVREVSG